MYFLGRRYAMNIALLGASGNIGKRILSEALSRGHSVTAIVRHPEKITDKHERLVVQKGDVLDQNALTNLIQGFDVLVSAIAPDTGNLQNFVVAAKNLVTAVKQAGVKRLVVVGGAGSLEVSPGVRLVDTPAIPESWKPMVRSHIDALDVYRDSHIDWTFFSPAGTIEPGERTGIFRLGETRLVTDAKGESRISMEDYAVAMVNEIEKAAHIRKQFTIGY
jgi:putative NADH-flavin reductase